jgi:hypothetical protein
MKARHILFAGLFWIVVFMMSCAHVQPVVTKCAPSAEQAVIDATIGALAQDDYEAELAKVGVAVLPCVLVATVQEIVDSLSGVKAAGLDAAVVQRHAREWLAVHSPGGSHASIPATRYSRFIWLRYA